MSYDAKYLGKPALALQMIQRALENKGTSINI
jgi:hypothetical protein